MKFLLVVLVIHVIIALINRKRTEKVNEDGKEVDTIKIHPAGYLLR